MIDIIYRMDLSGILYQFCLDYTLKMEDILCGFSFHLIGRRRSENLFTFAKVLFGNNNE